MLRRLVLLIVGNVLICGISVAATPQSYIYIDGTIVAKASCKFTGANPIKVEYGDVYISDIDSGKYSQPINFGGLQCSGTPGSKQLQMQVSGSYSTIGGVNALNTSASGLGIQFLANNTPIALDNWFDINASSPPVLMAKLVKNSNASLSDGQEFSATATLIVTYN